MTIEPLSHGGLVEIFRFQLSIFQGVTNPASATCFRVAQAGTTLKKPKEPRPDTPAPWKPSTQGDLMSALKVRGMFFGEFGSVGCWHGGRLREDNDGFHFK